MTRVRIYYRVSREDSDVFEIDASPDDIGFAECSAAVREAEPFEEIEVDDFDVLEEAPAS